MPRARLRPTLPSASPPPPPFTAHLAPCRPVVGRQSGLVGTAVAIKRLRTPATRARPCRRWARSPSRLSAGWPERFSAALRGLTAHGFSGKLEPSGAPPALVAGTAARTEKAPPSAGFFRGQGPGRPSSGGASRKDERSASRPGRSKSTSGRCRIDEHHTGTEPGTTWARVRADAIRCQTPARRVPVVCRWQAGADACLYRSGTELAPG